MNSVIVHGKEYPLALTVQAFAEISDACPGKDIQRMTEISSMPTSESMLMVAKIAVAMSRAAENVKKFDNPKYQPHPLTMDAVITLSIPEYQKVMEPVITALKEQMGGQTVAVAKAKGQKKTGESAELASI